MASPPHHRALSARTRSRRRVRGSKGRRHPAPSRGRTGRESLSVFRCPLSVAVRSCERTTDNGQRTTGRTPAASPPTLLALAAQTDEDAALQLRLARRLASAGDRAAG